MIRTPKKAYDRLAVKFVIKWRNGEDPLVLVKVAPLNINDHLLSSRVGHGLNAAGGLDIGTIGSCSEDGADKGVGVLVGMCQKCANGVVHQGGYCTMKEYVKIG